MTAPQTVLKSAVASEIAQVVASVPSTPAVPNPAQLAMVQSLACPGPPDLKLPYTSAMSGVSTRNATTANVAA